MRFQAQHFDEQTISSLVIQVLLTGASNKKPVDTNNQRHTYIKKSHNFLLPFITWEEEALHRLTASQPHLYCTASGLLSHRKKLLYSMRPSPSFTDMELFQNGGGIRAFSACCFFFELSLGSSTKVPCNVCKHHQLVHLLLAQWLATSTDHKANASHKVSFAIH